MSFVRVTLRPPTLLTRAHWFSSPVSTQALPRAFGGAPAKARLVSMRSRRTRSSVRLSTRRATRGGRSLWAPGPALAATARLRHGGSVATGASQGVGSRANAVPGARSQGVALRTRRGPAINAAGPGAGRSRGTRKARRSLEPSCALILPEVRGLRRRSTPLRHRRRAVHRGVEAFAPHLGSATTSTPAQPRQVEHSRGALSPRRPVDPPSPLAWSSRPCLPWPSPPVRGSSGGRHAGLGAAHSNPRGGAATTAPPRSPPHPPRDSSPPGADALQAPAESARGKEARGVRLLGAASPHLPPKRSRGGGSRIVSVVGL